MNYELLKKLNWIWVRKRTAQVGPEFQKVTCLVRVLRELIERPKLRCPMFAKQQHLHRKIPWLRHYILEYGHKLIILEIYYGRFFTVSSRPESEIIIFFLCVEQVNLQ